jgi:hypothetical protein
MTRGRGVPFILCQTPVTSVRWPAKEPDSDNLSHSRSAHEGRSVRLRGWSDLLTGDLNLPPGLLWTISRLSTRRTGKEEAEK